MDPITTLGAPIILGLTTGLPTALCIGALLAMVYSGLKVVWEHWGGGNERTGRGLLADAAAAMVGPGFLALIALGIILVPGLFA